MSTLKCIIFFFFALDNYKMALVL